MKKLIQRAEYVQKQAMRRRARKAAAHEKGELSERRRGRNTFLRHANDLIREERRTRREQWDQGLIAPHYNVGENAKRWGAIHIRDAETPHFDDPRDRPAWFPLREGDRVVVLRGPDRGKISTILKIDEDKLNVRVKELNQVDIFMPKWMQTEDNDYRDVITQTQDLSWRDVKLVYPLPDPKTGVPVDVVIDRLEKVEIRGERGKKENLDGTIEDYTKGQRVIAGTNTIIPWPAMLPPEYELFDDDTSREFVELATFVEPPLLRPPMPMSVIDELRNKYSRFRTRHDDDFVAKVEAQAARKEGQKGLARNMRTPLQELAVLRARQRNAAARVLSEDQLARIGEVMALERSRVAQAEPSNAA